ncbi:enhancer of rudimentary family protein [Basidiobolus meristosporus CBS 931.73]|uniref:Enhancer of rudimentary family protein n=1 Tax=Basidiobolus meristosporus CBS 931.73 TaxID=1314790 RepID=A0A1Y1YMB7_9FUNG|nr:enhancer of rudimentary family protein [Basidiobolus meristosporus CBS 931.73]|eukprot:ORX99159.1 enhancer of rudimentary family protein [Basidiobolus meristosporus CBS 931.73]
MHTILLIQKSNDIKTRTFVDHETISLAVEDVIKMYENRLKSMNPNTPHINYHIDDLNKFVDMHNELAAMVYDDRIKAYVPHDKSWIKMKIHNHLKQLARSQR